MHRNEHDCWRHRHHPHVPGHSGEKLAPALIQGIAVDLNRSGPQGMKGIGMEALSLVTFHQSSSPSVGCVARSCELAFSCTLESIDMMQEAWAEANLSHSGDSAA